MFSAFLDANVLVPITLTDTLLRCASAGLFVPNWSGDVLREVRFALLRIESHLGQARIDYRIGAMQTAFPQACVTGYETLVDTIHLPDPDDRHVIAAAHLAHDDTIVTANLKDFPAAELELFNLVAISVDDFLCDMLDLFPSQLRQVIAGQANDTSDPPLSESDILIGLGRAGAPKFVQAFRRVSDLGVA